MRIALGMIVLAAVGALALYMTSADARYHSAGLLYQQGDFEKASILCQKALQRNPRHAAARALYTELQFILGRGKATWSHCGEYDRFMRCSFTSSLELLSKVDQALERANGYRVAEDREAGMVEVRKALEFLKWMPAGSDLEARRNRAEFLKILLASAESTDD